jgi:hypothetical protein
VHRRNNTIQRMMRKNLIELFQLKDINMFKKVLSFLISFALIYEGNGQATITEVGKNYVEIQIQNQSASAKQTINPYFLANSRLKGNNYIFKLFKYKYRFYMDTLFLYLNDTTIIPGIEKYNLGDSIRLLEGFKKYDTLSPQDEFKIKYSFPKEPFTHLVVFYSFTDLSQNDKKSEVLFYERKRRKRK